MEGMSLGVDSGRVQEARVSLSILTPKICDVVIVGYAAVSLIFRTFKVAGTYRGRPASGSPSQPSQERLTQRLAISTFPPPPLLPCPTNPFPSYPPGLSEASQASLTGNGKKNGAFEAVAKKGPWQPVEGRSLILRRKDGSPSHRECFVALFSDEYKRRSIIRSGNRLQALWLTCMLS